MHDEKKIDDLLAPLREAVGKAYSDGFSAGYSEAITKASEAILALGIGALFSEPKFPPNGQPTDTNDDPTSPEMGTRHPAATLSVRAPKGLLDEILESVLRERPGLTQSEVEEAVVAADDRIAAKSVYNKLRFWETQGKRYRRQGARWYRIADIPPPWAKQSSLQGETGGLEPPASDDDLVG